MCSSPITIEVSAGPIQVACKQCLNCRINRQSALTLRNVFEDNDSILSSFWTLTYNQEEIEEKGELLDWKDLQNFCKRLRAWNTRNQKNFVPVRYFACGEYGSKSGRKHFHLLIYNSHIPDPSQTDLLTKLWPHGFVYIGTVTPSSIRYTARYTLKFADKGLEGRASWSRKPSLGERGVRLYAHRCRERGLSLEGPPTMISIGEHKFVTDHTTRKHFWESYNGREEPPEEINGHIPQKQIRAHRRWLENAKFGDPVAAHRAARETKLLTETARLHFGETL
jgi:hypothetical protein